MRRFAVPMVLGALAMTAVSSQAEAQYVFLGGGPSIPLGKYKDDAKTGWLLQGGVGFDVGSKGAFIEAEGFYGSNKHELVGTFKEKTNIVAFMAALGYSFGGDDAKVSPYVLGGAGLLAHQFRSDDPAETEETETKFGFTGAAGLSFRLGAKARFWLEGRFISSSGTTVLPLMAGITLDLGGGGN